MGSDHHQDLLEQVATLVDASCADQPDHTAVLVELDGPDVVLGLHRFASHPTEALAGFVAPARWWGLVVCCPGRAHFLDEPDQPPERITSTYGRSREGHEVSLLRRGPEVTWLTGPAEGRIPDLVRAALSGERVGSSP